jgi:2-desacetyl-2-hydroxyethyl bacteriochlorophyllide A dehydrogenase
MKTLTCISPGQFEYGEQPEPALRYGNAILRVRRVGICGTDIHAFEGTQPYFTYPRILGHEIAAEVVDIGTNDRFKVGDLVTVIPYFFCGGCIPCTTGKTNCCVSLNVCGVHSDGAMQEYLSVPAYSLASAKGLDLDALALVEPLSIGAHAVKRAAIRQDEFVLVVGAGPIGLGTIGFARIAGANVIVLDVNQSRLDVCTTQLHVQHTINAAKDNVTDLLNEITSGNMPTVIFDATGNLNAINQSFAWMAHGARYVLVGLQKGNISFSHPEFHKREATLMSSRNATREDFDNVMSAINEQLIKPSTYITHRTQFREVKDQFREWMDPANRVIKALVEL